MEFNRVFRWVITLSFALFCMCRTYSQVGPDFGSIRRLTNSEVNLQVNVTKGKGYRVEVSSNAVEWSGLSTLLSTGANNFADSGAPYRELQFYRAAELSETNVFTGDHLQTSEGEIVVHPVRHASFVMSWGEKKIYNDPVGGSSIYKNFGKANLILVSHSHSDHFDAATLSGVRETNGIIIAPQAVYSGLSLALKTNTIVLKNGTSTNVMGVIVEAIPAYNSNHPQGTGNGYVVTIGGKRLYMSGDTGDIAEMKALKNIDMAFVCMNTPYTMTLSQAVGAVRAFHPAVVYPYHYINGDNVTYTDVAGFKRQVGLDLGVEVRLRKWY
jgi:L-ascorbate metabolism protein UlaG (beta-lactamase superfamily)